MAFSIKKAASSAVRSPFGQGGKNIGNAIVNSLKRPTSSTPSSLSGTPMSTGLPSNPTFKVPGAYTPPAKPATPAPVNMSASPSAVVQQLRSPNMSVGQPKAPASIPVKQTGISGPMSPITPSSAMASIAAKATTGAAQGLAKPLPSSSAQLLAESQNIQSGNRQAAVDSSNAYNSTGTFKTQMMPSLPGDNLQRPATQSSQPSTPAGADVIDALRKKIGSLSAPSAEEQALNDQLAQFRGASQQAVAGLEGQGRGITTDLIRGQQGLLNTQNQLQEQTLLDRIATASAQRQSQLQAAQNEYQIAAAEQARQDQLTAPTTLGNQILQYDPATGQYKSLYTAPSQPGEAKRYEVGGSLVDENGNVVYQGATSGGDGFSLSPGQVRYDASGNVIASGGPATPKEPTQAAYDAYGFATRMDNSTKIIDNLDQEFTGAMGQGLKWAPEFLKSDDRKSIEQAEADFLNATLRRESGASISPSEFETGRKQYFPQPGDNAEQLAQKKTNRDTVLNSVKTQAQNVYNQQGSSTQPQDTPQARQTLQQQGWSPEQINEFFTNDLSTSQNGSTWGNLGTLSEKYESGGNPGAIGYDSTGGYSYGTYQLAHNNAQNFVNQSPFKTAFSGIKFNSPQWIQKWKEVAQKAPQQFAAAQKEYIAKTHFEPQVQKLQKAGINVALLPQVVKDAIWSTAVQHGANTDVVTRAFSKLPKNASPAEILKAIYLERWSGGARFASSTPAVKKSVFNRFFGPQGELAMAMKRLNNNNIA